MISFLANQEEFDQRYRLTEILAGTGGAVQQLRYIYDAVNNVTEIIDTLEPEKAQAFAYDDLYRLTNATGIYGSIGYTYDNVGNRLSRTENDATSSYSYESGSNRLLAITDGNGQMTKTFSYDAGGNTLSDGSKNFIYDQDNRLITASENDTLLGEYVYNAFGQRTVKASGDALTIYLYDQAGNLIAEADETGEIQNEYIWLNGRLLAVAKKQNVVTAVEAVVDINPDTLNIKSNGKLTCFIELPDEYAVTDIDVDSITLNGTVYAQSAVIRDHNGNGIDDLKTKFDRQELAAVVDIGDAVTITVDGIVGEQPFTGTDTIRVIGKKKRDWSSRLDEADGTVPVAQANASTTEAIYFYHTDHLGTPKLVTDIDGNVVWKADAEPFGETDVVVEETVNDFRFPGQIFDAETGLHYNWNRYYDPITGRYVTSDPIGIAGGINLGCPKTRF